MYTVHPFWWLGYIWMEDPCKDAPAICQQLAIPQSEQVASVMQWIRHFRSMPVELRNQLLHILRMKSSTLPWTAIHSSWLYTLLSPMPPVCAIWSLETLPSRVRETLYTEFSELRTTPGGPPPAWWTRWLAWWLRRCMDYPELPPWDHPEPPRHLPGAFWQKDAAWTLRILHRYGLVRWLQRLRYLPREEAQRQIWALPPDLARAALQLADEKPWLEDDFWPDIGSALSLDTLPIEKQMVRIAIADWVRAGCQLGQDATLLRLAYRLPREIGQWVRADLTAPWRNTPIRPDPVTWQQRLAEWIERTRTDAF